MLFSYFLPWFYLFIFHNPIQSLSSTAVDSCITFDQFNVGIFNRSGLTRNAEFIAAFQVLGSTVQSARA
jgi:hypothetical protein